MDALHEQIQSAAELISLILVFTTILFDIRYPQLQKDIESEIPAGPIARKRHKDILVKSFLLKSLPITIVNGAAFFLFLPFVVEILQNSRFAPWGFDFVISAFMFIAIFELLFALWAGFLSMKLLLRIYKASRSPT